MMRTATLILLLAVTACCTQEPSSGHEQSIPTAALPHAPTPPSSSTPAPGPVPLRDVEQLHAYLCSAEFAKGGDSWTFSEDGTYSSRLGGVESGGHWTTTAEGLWLSRQGNEEATTLPLRWLDGKYRIEIDGVQYMRDWDIFRDRPRQP